MSGESCNIKWNTYTHHLADMLGDILTSELYSDVSLECEGGRLQAHRAVLSACSPFFKHIFEEDDQEHPVIWMPGIQIEEMEAILQFMYCGQTSFEQKKTYQSIAELVSLGGPSISPSHMLEGLLLPAPVLQLLPARCHSKVLQSPGASSTEACGNQETSVPLPPRQPR